MITKNNQNDYKNRDFQKTYHKKLNISGNKG